MRLWNVFTMVSALGMGGVLAGCGAGEEGSIAAPITRGAAFTTFSTDVGGCHPGSSNGINCNHYECETSVYVNGGPNRPRGANVLEDGSYYFTVIAPGHQNGGAAQGAIGNLSDNVAHAGTTDLGSGDTIADRTFTMSHGALVYGGSHATGTSPNGQPIVGVARFDVTPNPGGVYIIAICRSGSSDPADCKFDAFKTDRCDSPPPPPPCELECSLWDTACVVCPPACDSCCLPDSKINCTPCL